MCLANLCRAACGLWLGDVRRVRRLYLLLYKGRVLLPVGAHIRAVTLFFVD